MPRDMKQVRSDDLRQMLKELELPRTKVHRGGDFQHIPVWRVVAIVSRRYGLGDDAERQLDSLVKTLGGHRLDSVDPWRVIPDLIKRLRGEPLPPRADLYALPDDLFDD